MLALLRRLARESAVASITLGGAFLVGSLLIICTSTNPFGLIGSHGLTLYTVGHLLHYPYSAYSSLFSGAFGAPDLGTASVTVSQTIPLIFTGLAVAFAFRGGLFNIGAEGQLYMGGIVAAWLGVTFSSAPGIVLLPVVLLGSLAAGMLWGSIAGYLKAFRGTHEVITTIMLNWIAIYGTTAMVLGGGPLNSSKAQGQAVSGHIGTGGVLPTLNWLGKSSAIDAGVYVAAVVVVVYWFVCNRTSLGYEIRAVGLNAGAAAYGGIPVKRRIILAMAIAGGLAGLAGGLAMADPSGSGTFVGGVNNFSPGWGFDGITIALLGKGNPIGIVLAAVLIAVLRTGSSSMQIAGVSPHMTELLQGIIVLFIALDVVVRKLMRRRRRGAASVGGMDPAGSEAQAWRGLLVLATVAGTIAILFDHLVFAGIALVLAVLYAASQRRLSWGVVAVALYCGACLALGLAVNKYL
jgi:ABC-type uncharacterized transport system permease subunit